MKTKRRVNRSTVEEVEDEKRDSVSARDRNETNLRSVIIDKLPVLDEAGDSSQPGSNLNPNVDKKDKLPYKLHQTF